MKDERTNEEELKHLVKLIDTMSRMLCLVIILLGLIIIMVQIKIHI